MIQWKSMGRYWFTVKNGWNLLFGQLFFHKMNVLINFFFLSSFITACCFFYFFKCSSQFPFLAYGPRFLACLPMEAKKEIEFLQIVCLRSFALLFFAYVYCHLCFYLFIYFKLCDNQSILL